MSSIYKFFIRTNKPKPYTIDGESLLLCWNPNVEFYLYENVEYRPFLSLDIDKLNNRTFEKPKSDEYYKVNSIMPEVFHDYYTIFLRTITDTVFLEEDYYYEQNRSKNYHEVQYFAGDKNIRNEIHIAFTDSIQNFSITLSRSKGYSYRPSWKKNGTPIEMEKFLQYFNLTLQFLADYNSYLIFVEDYIKHFRQLINGDNTFTGFIISQEQILSKIIQQLETRKQFIKDRLVKNDNDTPALRSQLRGELDGLHYAIKTIKVTL